MRMWRVLGAAYAAIGARTNEQNTSGTKTGYHRESGEIRIRGENKGCYSVAKVTS